MRPYVLDTWFYHSLGSYEFEAKCEMTSELGYDGIYFTLWTEPAWNDVARFGSVADRYGIAVSGVYVALDTPDNEAGNLQFLELLETIEGTTNIELALLAPGRAGVANSDPAGDDAWLPLLTKALPIAERRGLTISLYPHLLCWLERTEDALRICRKVDHPNLRTVFSAYHWYATDGGDLAGTLADASPLLSGVNICGSRKPADGGAPTVETLDFGELDTFAVLGGLKAVGYDGDVGIQGYSIGGDVYAQLARALRAYRDIERRIDAHPDWAKLRNDPVPGASGEDRED